jgi:hypothetical protein
MLSHRKDGEKALKNHLSKLGEFFLKCTVIDEALFGFQDEGEI